MALSIKLLSKSFKRSTLPRIKAGTRLGSKPKSMCFFSAAGAISSAISLVNIFKSSATILTLAAVSGWLRANTNS